MTDLSAKPNLKPITDLQIDKKKQNIDEMEEEIIQLKTKIQNKGQPGKKEILQKKEIQEIQENTVRDITGMKLKYPNPFSSRLENRAPQLFVREKNEKIDVYTRMCPFSLNDRRQPVILTKEEKEQMIQEHPDDVDPNADFIEYSTDAKDASKKFYYTCPRFWCLLTDKMVTEKDILEGKCGPKVNKVEDAIIPNNADEVPKDRYVYQFYDDKETKFPGFHKKQAPNGLCIPCCYNKWSTKEMKSRRDICQGKNQVEKIKEPNQDLQQQQQQIPDQTLQQQQQKIPDQDLQQQQQQIPNQDLEQQQQQQESPVEEELKRTIQEVENYVKGPEKYGPQLGEHRWGFLPIIVQKFLHEVNEDCQISKTNTNLKPNHMCLLRHGVETNAHQSFIACIASAMFYGQIDKRTKKPLVTKYIPNAKNDVPSIKEMKEIIINSLNIDKFIKYQNGDLITSFANPDLEVNIKKPEYVKTQLFKKIKGLELQEKESQEIRNSDSESVEFRTSNTGYEEQIAFFTRVVQAYETFILFLRDKSIDIDYTYLWDIVCMPNDNLFEAGINLIILEIPEDDITNNIELVCPSNHYSANPYNSKRRSLFLIKRETYFEPIYGYYNNESERRILVTKTFSEHDRQLSKTMKAVFNKIIKPTLGERCRALLSKPNEYRFKKPLLLDELITTLLRKKYAVKTQILNYQGKVIGVLAVNRDSNEGFIPCFPSALTSLKQKNSVCKDLDEEERNLDENDEAEVDNCDYPFTYVSDNIWKPYNETLDFLKTYYDYNENSEKEKEKDCSDEKGFCRVVKDEQIIGFLTNTNQFVRIYEPVPVSSVNDRIKTITNNDMMVADMETLTSKSVDSKRVDYIKRIQLETGYFNVFRNTLRILFNDYSNSAKRKEIQSMCNQKYVLYKHQLDSVIELLYDLVDNTIIFSTKEQGYNYNVINQNDMHGCITNTKSSSGNKCNESTGICRITDSKCTLILPKQNLLTGSDNEAYYYGRMADELIRYNRIKSFIFKPQSYLSFGQVKYNLRENEIIVLQDLLNADFFKDMNPVNINRYAKNQTFDTAAPIVATNYTNEYQLDEVLNRQHERNCFHSEPSSLSSGLWKKRFPNKFTEISYKGSNFCAIYMIIDIVEKLTNKKMTIEQVKEHLLEEYMRLTDSYKDAIKVNKIIDILKEEYQYDAGQLYDRSLTFEQMIVQEGFSPVNFDLWILLNRYKIPSLFISTKEIPETRFNKTEFVCFTNLEIMETVNEQNIDKASQYVFIVTPAMIKRSGMEAAEYKVVLNATKEMVININEMKDATAVIDAIKKYYTIEDYLDHIYEKDNTTKYKPRKKGTRVIEFVEEPEEGDKKQEEDKKQDEDKKQNEDKKQEEPKLVSVLDEMINVTKEQGPVAPAKTLRDYDKKVVKVKKPRKIKPTLIIEEKEEKEEKEEQKKQERQSDPFSVVKAITETLPDSGIFNINNIVNSIDTLSKQVNPLKKEKAKTRKVREKPLKVNPAGQVRAKKTKKAKTNIEFNIIE